MIKINTFCVIIILFLSCQSNSNQHSAQKEINSDTINNDFDTISYMDIAPLKDFKDFQYIYDTLIKFKSVQNILKDSIKSFDKLELTIFNGRHINETVYRMPNDMLDIRFLGTKQPDIMQSFTTFYYYLDNDSIIEDNEWVIEYEGGIKFKF